MGTATAEEGGVSWLLVPKGSPTDKASCHGFKPGKGVPSFVPLLPRSDKWGAA